MKKRTELSEGVKEQQSNQERRLMWMKATTEEPVFSGLVERCPSLPQTQDCLDEADVKSVAYNSIGLTVFCTNIKYKINR